MCGVGTHTSWKYQFHYRNEISTFLILTLEKDNLEQWEACLENTFLLIKEVDLKNNFLDEQAS